MKDSDSNHAQTGLPSNNTLPPAPDNLEPPRYIQLAYGSNYYNYSSAYVVNANKLGYTWLNGGSTSNTTNREINYDYGGNDTWAFEYNSQQLDGYANSIHNGQTVVGDMASYAHLFQIYKYKVTSVDTVSQTFTGGTANRKIGIEAIGTWDSLSARQTAEDASLDLFTEYYNQPTDSIWRNTGSADYGTIVYNQTKSIFYWYMSNETGYIYANTLSETTAFDVDDEIIVLFE